MSSFLVDRSYKMVVIDSEKAHRFLSFSPENHPPITYFFYEICLDLTTLID